ncbi:hypothetical protein [Neomoorella mulderi]|uniref:Uncharacterized protein n=1 Tax=Moorella mulderi DSM 14980 TaxID=1122241 RepID=A0A151ATP6_9FIRM|nr:hypothetical protein [Moorella mulderi]KYH30962.1 hypothetical protein MOMUL_27460 [Moorella mulderi DSM 14980]
MKGIVGDGGKRGRGILVRNPKEAEKDRLEREKILARLKEELKAIGDLKGEPHTKACCQLIAHPDTAGTAPGGGPGSGSPG